MGGPASAEWPKSFKRAFALCHFVRRGFAFFFFISDLFYCKSVHASLFSSFNMVETERMEIHILTGQLSY